MPSANTQLSWNLFYAAKLIINAMNFPAIVFRLYITTALWMRRRRLHDLSRNNARGNSLQIFRSLLPPHENSRNLLLFRARRMMALNYSAYITGGECTNN